MREDEEGRMGKNGDGGQMEMEEGRGIRNENQTRMNRWFAEMGMRKSDQTQNHPTTHYHYQYSFSIQEY